MKKSVLIFLSIILLVIITGCGNKDEVTQEIIDYHNDHWLEVQQMKVTGIGILKDQVFPDNALNEEPDFDVEKALETLEEVIEYLESIEPNQKDIQELHALFIEAERFSLTALEDQITYVNGGIDGEQVEENNEKLIEKFEAFVSYRDELMKKHKIEWGAETDIPGARDMKRK